MAGGIKDDDDVLKRAIYDGPSLFRIIERETSTPIVVDTQSASSESRGFLSNGLFPGKRSKGRVLFSSLYLQSRMGSKTRESKRFIIVSSSSSVTMSGEKTL